MAGAGAYESTAAIPAVADVSVRPELNTSANQGKAASSQRRKSILIAAGAVVAAAALFLVLRPQLPPPKGSECVADYDGWPGEIRCGYGWHSPLLC